MKTDAWVCLITIKSDEGSVAHILDKPTFVVGRTREADLPVIEQSVSRKHLTVQVDGDSVWIPDHNSANGTYLNGDRIHSEVPTHVYPTDRIRLGSNSAELQLLVIPKPFEMKDAEGQKQSVQGSDRGSVQGQVEERMRAQLERELSDARSIADQEISRVRTAAERELHQARQQSDKQVQNAKRAAESELQQARLTIEQLQGQQKKDQEVMRTQMANDNLNRRTALETEIAQLRQQALVKVGEEMLKGRKEADKIVTDAQRQIQNDLDESSRAAANRLTEAQETAVRLIDDANAQARTIVNEARQEAAQVRLEASEESRLVQQEAHKRQTKVLARST